MFCIIRCLFPSVKRSLQFLTRVRSTFCVSLWWDSCGAGTLYISQFSSGRRARRRWLSVSSFVICGRSSTVSWPSASHDLTISALGGPGVTFCAFAAVWLWSYRDTSLRVSTDLSLGDGRSHVQLPSVVIFFLGAHLILGLGRSCVGLRVGNYVGLALAVRFNWQFQPFFWGVRFGQSLRCNLWLS